MSYYIYSEVRDLLTMYDEYKKIGKDLSVISLELAKAKLRKESSDKLQVEFDNLSKKQKDISDSMTFSSPSIWIQYKYEAYKNENQPILTLHDLRVHCAKPDYICTKRYTYLNQELNKAGFYGLDDEVYPASISLKDILALDDLANIEKDKNFIQNWQSYEYYKDSQDNILKWHNFS